MEKTPLREAFFDEVKKDPYAHIITRQCAMMWAYGYRQAQKDNSVYPSESFDDLYHKALEYMTDMKTKAEAEIIIAMAQMGPLLDIPGI